MKRLLIIFLLFIPILSFAQNKWYVKPDGDDSKDGTSIENAWETWGKAFNHSGLSAGDTVYFMDGVYYRDISDGESGWYYPSRTDYAGYKVTNGSGGNYIHYWAYPGATPILDCTGSGPVGASHNYAIYSAAVYCHFKGLHIRNLEQLTTATELVHAWDIAGAATIFENCVVYNVHGNAFALRNYGNTEFINCDAYSCCDSLGDQISQPSNPLPGNDGGGFTCFTSSDSNNVVTYTGCRAWQCGDQGFSVNNIGKSYIDSCWSFLNGMMEGDGWGEKAGWYRNMVKITNSLFVFNRAGGITTNDATGSSTSDSLVMYNNTIWHNYDWSNDYNGVTVGLYILNTNNSDEDEQHRIFKNNIVYDNQDYDFWSGSGALYTSDYNATTGGTPDGITVDDNDFVLLPDADSAGVMDVLGQARQADGSLPDLGDYFKLSSESNLIDAGIDVGYGDDIGAFQYSEQNPAVKPTAVTGSVKTLSKTTCAIEGNTTDDGGGTVSAKGICYSTEENPDLDDDYTDEGGGAGEFNSDITGLTENTTYYVRAYSTNGVGTSYGEQISFLTKKTSIIMFSGKYVKR